ARPQRDHVAHGSQRATDQPWDLLRPARGTALVDVAADALGGRTGEHRVLGGDPSLAPAAHPAGHVVVDRRGAQHPRVAERDEHRPGGRVGEVTFEGDGAELVGLASVWPHSWYLSWVWAMETGRPKVASAWRRWASGSEPG